MEKRSRRRPNKPSPNKPCSPEFFKVFLPRHLSSPKILIPPVYIKHFSRTIKERITLKNESGKTWHVSVERNPNGFFISTGWQSFVSHSRLCVGNFLVFQYDTNYSFLVKIYGTDGCKRDSFGIETNATHIKIKQEEEEEEEEEDEDEVEQNVVKRARVGKEEDYSPSVITRTRLSRGMNEVKKTNVRPKMPNDFEDFAKADPTVPKLPCFVSSVGRYDLYYMQIPKETLRRKDVRLEPEMVLRNSRGEEWSVKVWTKKDGRRFFGKGWNEFRKQNNVALGDCCGFTFDTLTFGNRVDVQISHSR